MTTRWLCALLILGGCARLDRADPRDPSAVLARPSGPRVVSPGRGLIVASYNVHGASAETIARAISAHPHLRAADVLLLQEVEADPRALAERSGLYVAYAPGYQRGDAGTHGVAIASRAPLRDPRVIELPRHDVMVNSARRVALRTTAELDGQAVLLYSVHLDNRINPGDRLGQLLPVLADAATHPELPAIVAGDMNTSPFCWIGHLVPVPCGLQHDCVERAARAHGFEVPAAGSGATSKWLGMRLDAIYTRHLAITGSGVDDVLRISDHLPLWVAVGPADRRADAAEPAPLAR